MIHLCIFHTPWRLESLVVPLFTILMAACAAGPPAVPSAATTAPAAPTTSPSAPMLVRMGILDVPSDLAIWAADELGYFRELGIAIELQTFRSGIDMVPATAAGQLDVGSGGPSAGLFNAMRREIPLKIVADKSSAGPANSSMGLMARKDAVDIGEIRAVNDLRGRRVGISATGSISHYLLDRALGRVGLGVSDVEMIEIPPPEMATAISNRALDAVILTEPLLGIGERQGLWTRLLWEHEIVPEHTSSILIYAPHFADNEFAAAQRFATAYLRGLRLYYDAFVAGKRPRSEVTPILIKHSRIKDPAIWEQIRVSSVDPDGYPNKRSLVEEQDWHFAQGLLTDRVDLDSVIDIRYIDYALQQLGRYPR
jgi:NitT/TauT family transport system substrate-binding protein